MIPFERDGTGPILVFIHGWAGTNRVWDKVVHRLCDDFTCLRTSLNRGAPPADGDYLGAFHTDLIEALDQALKPGEHPRAFVGWSFGGVAVLDAARRGYPVPRAVIIASAARYLAEEGNPHGVDPRQYRALKLGMRRDPQSTLDGFVGRVCEDDRVRADLTGFDLDELKAQLDAIAAYDLRDAVSGMDFPFLVLHGRRDRTMPQAQGEALARLAGARGGLPRPRRRARPAPYPSSRGGRRDPRLLRRSGRIRTGGRRPGRGLVNDPLIARNFSKNAATYDRTVQVQKELLRLVAEGLEGGAGLTRVLDVGCGTAALTDALDGAHPRPGGWAARMVDCDLAEGMIRRAREKHPAGSAIVADMHDLPFREGAFDGVVSSAAFQWARPVERVLDEAVRVLKPGGSFSVSFFIEGTLRELYAVLDEVTATHEPPLVYAPFPRLDAWLAARPEVKGRLTRITLKEAHASALDLLRHLKRIGANTAPRARDKVAFAPGRMARIDEVYARRFGSGRSVIASYETAFLAGRKRA